MKNMPLPFHQRLVPQCSSLPLLCPPSLPGRLTLDSVSGGYDRMSLTFLKRSSTGSTVPPIPSTSHDLRTE